MAFVPKVHNREVPVANRHVAWRRQRERQRESALQAVLALRRQDAASDPANLAGALAACRHLGRWMDAAGVSIAGAGGWRAMGGAAAAGVSTWPSACVPGAAVRATKLPYPEAAVPPRGGHARCE